MGERLNPCDEGAGAVVWQIVDEPYMPAIGRYRRPFWQGLISIIATFHVNIGL